MPNASDKAPTIPIKADNAISKKLADLIHPVNCNESITDKATSFLGKTAIGGGGSSGSLCDPDSKCSNLNLNFDSDKIRMQLEESVKVPKFEFELPGISLHDVTKNINDVIGQKLDDLISHNMRVLMLGAAFGAAISAGVLIGIGTISATTSIVFNHDENHNRGSVSSNSSGNGKYVQKRLYRRWSMWLRKVFLFSTSSSNKANAIIEYNENEGGNENQNHSMQGRTSSLCILQASPSKGIPSTGKASPEDQCRECLNSLTLSLGKQRLLWDDVLKITAYLVFHECDAKTFRNVLEEFPTSASEMKKDNVVILYVHQLEDENACIQVEVLVDKKVR